MKNLKGHHKFWIAFFIAGYTWLTYQAIWVTDYEKSPHGSIHFVITLCIISADIIWLFGECKCKFVKSRKHFGKYGYYFGIFWLLYQPLKFINKFLDKILK